MSILLGLVKFARFLVLNVRLRILSRMVRVTSPWYVNVIVGVTFGFAHTHSKDVDVRS